MVTLIVQARLELDEVDEVQRPSQLFTGRPGTTQVRNFPTEALGSANLRIHKPIPQLYVIYEYNQSNENQILVGWYLDSELVVL